MVAYRYSLKLYIHRGTDVRTVRPCLRAAAAPFPEPEDKRSADAASDGTMYRDR